MRQRRPLIWINASDIYNRTPFVFGRVLFGALCSDLADYPVSLAVAASAAVPVFFTPIVVQNFTGACPMPLPDWVPRVLSNPDAPPMLRLFANALERYHSGEVRYVKLLDGGIVDNYGLAGLTIARLASFTPYGPLEPEEGVKLRACCSSWSMPAAHLPAIGRRRSKVRPAWGSSPRYPIRRPS